MPYTSPTLTTIAQRVKSDMKTTLPGGNPFLRRSNLRVIAEGITGAVNGLYRFQEWLATELFVDTAEDPTRIAGIHGIVRKAAVESTGNMDITGTDGISVPAGTSITRQDGVEYTVDALVTISGGVGTLALTAVDGGVDGDCEAGEVLTFASPISGIDSTGTVDADGITGGIDEESDEALVYRTLLRLQRPSHGGADFDYVAWALENAGVTRAWAFPNACGLGSVGLTWVKDDNTGGIDGVQAINPVPTAAGSGYVAGEVLTVSGGGGTGCQLLIVTVNGSGGVTGLAINEGGSGYTAGSGLATTGGSGSSCTIEITTTTPNGWCKGAKLPGAADITAMEDYIDEHTDPATGETVGKPMTARLFCYALSPVVVNYTIANLSPNTAAVKSAIELELADLHLDYGYPTGTLTLNRMHQYIGQANGELDHDLTLPAADVALAQNELAVLNDPPVTWA